MRGVIFLETLRRSWRQILYWGLGLMIWASFPFTVAPDEEALAGYAELIEEMPPALVSAFGLGDAGSLGTVEGFVGYSYFGYLLLIMSVFAVIAGLNVSANEEEGGMLDVMLALPLPRWRVIVEKVAAYSLMAGGIVGVGFLGLLLGDALLLPDYDVEPGRYLVGSLGVLPGTLFVLMMTAFLGTVLRRRATTMAAAGGLVAGLFMFDMVGRAAQSDAMDTLRQVSYFAHYTGAEVLRDGMTVGGLLAVLLVAVALFVASIVTFQRREIAL